MRPNIIFIMSDDHASRAISAYGGGLNQTPNLDRLANEGMRHDACYVTNSICTPSRAAIICGTHNHVNCVTTLETHMQFGVGVGVRSGASFRPTLRSANDVREMLLQTASVAFVGAGTSGAFFRSVLDKLGITAAMQAKLRPGDIQPILLQLTKGEVDIVVMPVPLIMAHPGAELAGALPEEMQDVIVITAGKAASSGNADAADKLLKFLMSPAATATFVEKGYERLK